VIIDQTSHLETDQARQVAEVALKRAGSETTGQLRARIQRLVIAVDPDSARERYKAKLRDRRVVIEATETGTATCSASTFPPARPMRSCGGSTGSPGPPRPPKTAEDRRSIDQIRADIFLDLLNGGEPGQSHADGAVVDIRVDLTTLARLDDNPGEIPGWGPVIADIARQVVEEQDGAQWQVTVTDPESGDVVHTGTTRRRPTAAQRRTVEATAMTCVFPGCRMPARDSDLDHRNAWADGGPTREDNLEPLCRHDHRLKHAGWKLEGLETGEYLWTSPLGLKYTVDPRGP